MAFSEQNKIFSSIPKLIKTLSDLLLAQERKERGWGEVVNSLPLFKVRGCYLVHFSCSPTSTDLIYTTKLMCMIKSMMKCLQKLE